MFDRLTVAYKSGEGVKTVHKSKISALLENGEISDETVIFNNRITTKAEFGNKWQIPLRESWLAPKASKI